MKSTTSLVARQCRIQEWAGQIKECNQRPEGMSVDEWCQQHDITKTTYYYRLRQVRKACLDNIPQDKLPLENADDKPQTVVAVPASLLGCVSEKNTDGSVLTVSVGNISIYVKEDTSPSLLAMVLGVAAHAE